MKKIAIISILLLMILSYSAYGETILRGQCSWYGEDFHGRLTASGERYNMYDYTAAHKTLPFGTMVRVTLDETERSVTVRINDRGPYVEGRIIDLSFTAAQDVGLVPIGVGSCTVEVLNFGENDLIQSGSSSQPECQQSEELHVININDNPSSLPSELQSRIETPSQRPAAVQNNHQNNQAQIPEFIPDYILNGTNQNYTSAVNSNPANTTINTNRPQVQESPHPRVNGNMIIIDENEFNPGGSGLKIQFGAYAVSRNAQTMMCRLMDSGIDCEVIAFQENGSVIYRVLSGELFGDRNSINQSIREYSDQGIEACIFIVP